MSTTFQGLQPDPRRLRLRAGVLTLPRIQGLLQVGVDPGHRVLLPDTASMAAFLAQLANGTTEPSDPQLQRALATLRAHDLVVDEDERERRLRARAEARIRILGPTHWSAELAGLLLGQGITLVDVEDRADLTVSMTVGEPAREHVDALSHPGDPILLVAAIDARVRLGPFVLPGTTACLRCVDAHYATADPGRAALPDPRLTPRVEICPLLLRYLLLRTAAEVLVWAEGRCPRSWSATTWIDEELTEEHQAWTRHPHCGCSWEDLLMSG